MDVIFLLFLVTIKLLQDGMEFINFVPEVGSSRKTAVDNASASIVVGAWIDTLTFLRGDDPVFGFIM